jgi:transposase
MKYTFDQKLSWVIAYKRGDALEAPPGCKWHTFKNKILQWTRIYDMHGPEALRRKLFGRVYAPEEKLAAVKRIFAGESAGSVAVSLGMPQPSVVLSWRRRYLKDGFPGLQSMRKGRPPKMGERKRKPERLDDSERAEFERMKAELERLRVENAALKKLKALEAEAAARSPKAIRRRQPRSSGKKG